VWNSGPEESLANFYQSSFYFLIISGLKSKVPLIENHLCSCGYRLHLCEMKYFSHIVSHTEPEKPLENFTVQCSSYFLKFRKRLLIFLRLWTTFLRNKDYSSRTTTKTTGEFQSYLFLFFGNFSNFSYSNLWHTPTLFTKLIILLSCYFLVRTWFKI